MSNTTPRSDEATIVQERQVVKRPKLFKVILHNDNFTTMEFVVEVLQEVFRKPFEEAVTIMLNVHERGMGVAGVYPAAVAESKISTVHQMAEAEGFPLRCSMEPE